MSKRTLVSSRHSLVAAALALGTSFVMVAEAVDDLRRAASVITSVEGPLGKGDI